MTEQYIDGFLYINDTAMSTTSTESRFMGLHGDTIRISENRTISSSSDDGYKGEICWDSNYIYVCVANNSWKRAALSTI